MSFLGEFILISLLLNVFNPGLSADTGVCYATLGCFNITDDFKHIIYRPINLLPETPERINTKIIFYSRNGSKNGQVLSQKWITSDKVSNNLDDFDGKKEIKFIIHGYLDSMATGRWMARLKDELLINGDYNVFIVDWSDGNGMPYSQASANCRVVGAQIALLINNLNNISRIKHNLIHLIGHSLGAHLAGYAGQKMTKYSKKIGRITALDPAEPFFQYMPNSVRLDRTDAEFVDILHTDSKSILQFGLGMSQPIGHIDFYPNGGNDQPGCSVKRVESLLSGDMGDATRKFVACNHDRAIEYFIESVNSEKRDCLFIAYSCDNWSAFNGKNKCNTCGKSGSFCSQMGINSIKWKNFKSNKKSKRFYIRTGSDKPFCVFQLKIEIPVKSIGDDSDYYSGRMKLKLNSGPNTSYAFLDTQDISSNDSYYSVMTLRDKQLFSSLDSIDFEWFEEGFDVFNPSTWKSFFSQSSEQNNNNNNDNRINRKELFINQINIKPLFTTKGSQIKIKRFCNKNRNSGIKPETSVKFNKNC